MWGNASLLKPCSCWFKAQFLQHSSLTPFSMSLGCTNMSQHGRKPRLYTFVLNIVEAYWYFCESFFEGLIQKLLLYNSTSLPSAPIQTRYQLDTLPSQLPGHGRTRSYLDCKGNQVTPQNMYVYIRKQEHEMDARPHFSKNKQKKWNDWPCLRVERIVTVRSIRPGWQPEPDRVCVREG